MLPRFSTPVGVAVCALLLFVPIFSCCSFVALCSHRLVCFALFFFSIFGWKSVRATVLTFHFLFLVCLCLSLCLLCCHHILVHMTYSSLVLSLSLSGAVAAIILLLYIFFLRFLDTLFFRMLIIGLFSLELIVAMRDKNRWKCDCMAHKCTCVFYEKRLNHKSVCSIIQRFDTLDWWCVNYRWCHRRRRRRHYYNGFILFVCVCVW